MENVKENNITNPATAIQVENWKQFCLLVEGYSKGDQANHERAMGMMMAKTWAEVLLLSDEVKKEINKEENGKI